MSFRLVPKAISDIWNAITPKRCKIGGKLVLITNRKSYMSFRLVPKSVTLNDLKRRNSGMAFILRYPTEFRSHVKLCLGLGQCVYYWPAYT